MRLEFLILVLAPPRNAIQSSSFRPPLSLFLSTLRLIQVAELANHYSILCFCGLKIPGRNLRKPKRERNIFSVLILTVSDSVTEIGSLQPLLFGLHLHEIHTRTHILSFKSQIDIQISGKEKTRKEKKNQKKNSHWLLQKAHIVLCPLPSLCACLIVLSIVVTVALLS
ncbi:hypothetical protein BDV29DRAFT_99261 [Aspergillus leporis]|uniref:Transmembrane protein n=1 Tax=Aspergillus leporis TaxID=41062 RepID=A0A5N5WFZ9_9EURO|nr:hypothetical protein BDV29DRAFT_99261 [Aspergillus leporis]